MNRELLARGDLPANHKRIYRLMKIHGLLLEKHTGRRPGRVHDGTIVVMRSNLRWCSDGFEFTCWNSEVVRGAFVLDAHDREVIAWRAVTGSGISGSDVRDMMLEAVETRFGDLRAPAPIEWLSDNGSPYTVTETRRFAAQLNLVPCFTPVASPQSNGMSEAFVKTLKRDYIRVHPTPDAATALDRIAGWFEDYNDNHPHSGLRMRSPLAVSRVGRDFDWKRRIELKDGVAATHDWTRAQGPHALKRLSPGAVFRTGRTRDTRHPCATGAWPV